MKWGKAMKSFFESVDEIKNLKIKWIIRTFKDRPSLVSKLEIQNMNEEAVRINRLNPLSTELQNSGIVIESSDPLQFLEIEPETWAYKYTKKLEGNGTGKFITGIANAKGKGAVIGCLSFNRFRGIFEMKDARDNSSVLKFNAYNDIDDHLMLPPEGTLSSEWIYVDCINDVFTGLEEWAQLAGKINNAVVSDPPAVGFYTWYYYRDYVSEKIMMDNTKFLAENKDRFPVNYVHIDWGWQRNFSSGDTIPNEKFPHGLKWLGQQIKNHGFTPSLWCNPFMYTTPTAEAPEKHPEIFLKDTAGNMVEHEPIRNIMANAWGDAPYMISPGVLNAIDVSNPESYTFLKKRYEWVRSNGYDMAMMDFVIFGRQNHAAGHRLKNPDVSTFEGIRKALFASRDGMGPGGNVLGCGTIYETAVGTSNLTRISLDAVANWGCVKVASNDLIVQYFMNDNLWTNYADGIFVRDFESPYWVPEGVDEEGNPLPMYLTDDEAEFYTAVTGLSQAAVMYTEDLQKLNPYRQWLLSMIMPIYMDGKFRPVDLFRNTSPKTIRLKCNDGGREWIIAAGLNWSNDIDDHGLDLSLLDLDADKEYHVFNVFDQKLTGKANSTSILGPVNAHGVILVNLVPDLKRPQVVGSDLHISQGGMEIQEVIWNENNGVLTIQLNDMFGRKGHIYVYVPGQFQPPEVDGSEIIETEEGGLLKIPVHLDGETQLELVFTKP